MRAGQIAAIFLGKFGREVPSSRAVREKHAVSLSSIRSAELTAESLSFPVVSSPKGSKGDPGLLVLSFVEGPASEQLLQAAAMR